MYRWFTNYTGRDWTPVKGYNAVFAEHVRLIREWFRLKKTGTSGVEVATDFWRKYLLQRETVYVRVDRFEWKGYTDYSYETPRFRLGIRLAREKPRGILARILNEDSQARIEEFFHNTLVIEFPREYPESPPRFRIDDRRYDTSSSSHDHHMFSGGWFCILASPSDWNSSRDTIVSGLNAALDWIIWHHQKFGW